MQNKLLLVEMSLLEPLGLRKTHHPTEHVLRQWAKYLVRKSRCAVPARARARGAKIFSTWQEQRLGVHN